ncbi:hypothetical protein CHELA40_12445 [Chelatococcus asaccharovorans]|nr:hypothetical protein CHELA40_12445 [Chelatococcus asaccharovorans]CAH1682645.1 hypothetical protein CHELA17_63163 [Chelatococcus asaccharovorans]
MIGRSPGIILDPDQVADHSTPEKVPRQYVEMGLAWCGDRAGGILASAARDPDPCVGGLGSAIEPDVAGHEEAERVHSGHGSQGEVTRQTVASAIPKV